MRCLQNQNGMALVTAMMLTLISMTIIAAMMYLLTQGTQMSGAQKRYHTALEASYGGAEIAAKEIIPLVFSGYSTSNLAATFAGNNLQASGSLMTKVRFPTSQWPSTLSKSLNPKDSPDFSFRLQGIGSASYTVYAKIVDTVKGNSDITGLQLEGSGVAEGSSQVTPQPTPFLYRIEIQGQGAKEQANVSVLYAY